MTLHTTSAGRKQDHHSDVDLEMAPLKPTEVSSEEATELVKSPTHSLQHGHPHALTNLQNHHHHRIGSSSVVVACFMYSFCSVSMVLTNKSLASGYSNFLQGDLNILLVVSQSIVAVASVELCKRLRWVEYPNFNLHTARLWAPVNVLFCFMLFSGMAALEHNSVPMVTIYKNITNIIVTAGDFYIFKTTAEPLVLLAFGIMLSGAIAAAWNDMYITMQGLFWMSMNCFTTAGYILSLKFATKNVKLSKFGMVFYNNILCIMFLLPTAMVRGDITLFLQTKELHTLAYLFQNIFAGFVGFFLNFASLNCVAATGPTTYAIVGSLNKIPVTILGYWLFENVIERETWFFIGVSLCGGFLYSYAKIQTGRRRMNRSGRS